jgi:hypothetical protein
MIKGDTNMVCIEFREVMFRDSKSTQTLSGAAFCAR